MSLLSKYIRQARSIDLGRILQNRVLLFTVNRYVGYAMQFLRGMLVAKFLGPYYFGVWGFLMLVRQYLSYTSLGFDHAVNVELATGSMSDTSEQDEIIQSALSGVTTIAGILVLCGLAVTALGISVFEKYSFSQYALPLAAIAGLTHIRQVLTNVHRVYGNLFRIGASELLSAVLPLLAVLSFRDDALVFALLGALVLSEAGSIVILALNAPFTVMYSLLPRRLGRLISVGIPLSLYNISFHLKMLAGRTVIGVFYPVETMGFFSLANSITTATLLGLRAVSWVIYPDILAKTSDEVADTAALRTVHRVNALYGTAVILVVLAMILGLPLIFLFLPEYKPIGDTLAILLMSQAVTSLSFGYNCAAVARKQQSRVAVISWVAVAIVTLLSLIAASLELGYVWVAISILVASFVFTILQARLGSRALNQRGNSTSWHNALPFGTLASIMVLLLGILLDYTALGALIGLLLFILTRGKCVLKLWNFASESVSAGGSMRSPPK